MNLDARSQEQMTVGSNTTIVPAVKIGSPITLKTLDTVIIMDDPNNGSGGSTIAFDENINDTVCSSDYNTSSTQTTRNASYLSCYEKYSERAVITNNSGDFTFADDDQIRFVYNGTTVQDLEDLISGANGTAAYTYIQYDFRSFNGGTNSQNYYLNFTVGDDSLHSNTGQQTNSYTHTLSDGTNNGFFSTGLIGQALINSPSITATGFGSLESSEALEVIVEVNLISGTGATLSAGTSYPITMDFVTFGQSNDGVNSSDRHNNGIWRLEVDEVTTNGGIFVGELDFIMLNQLNVNQTSTYNNTRPTTRRIESLFTMI
jgi:hypothetical protein